MYSIYGYKKVNYTRKSDNTIVDGINFYLVNADKVEGIEGNEVLSIYINSSKITGTVAVGSDADLQFSLMNGQAKVSGILIH